MRRLAWIALFVFAAASARAQDGSCLGGGASGPWKDYNKGVKWSTSLREAQDAARKDGKLVMLFMLAGDLDQDGC